MAQQRPDPPHGAMQRGGVMRAQRESPRAPMPLQRRRHCLHPVGFPAVEPGRHPARVDPALQRRDQRADTVLPRHQPVRRGHAGDGGAGLGDEQQRTAVPCLIAAPPLAPPLGMVCLERASADQIVVQRHHHLRAFEAQGAGPARQRRPDVPARLRPPRQHVADLAQQSRRSHRPRHQAQSRAARAVERGAQARHRRVESRPVRLVALEQRRLRSFGII